MHRPSFLLPFTPSTTATHRSRVRTYLISTYPRLPLFQQLYIYIYSKKLQPVAFEYPFNVHLFLLFRFVFPRFYQSKSSETLFLHDSIRSRDNLVYIIWWIIGGKKNSALLSFLINFVYRAYRIVKQIITARYRSIHFTAKHGTATTLFPSIIGRESRRRHPSRWRRNIARKIAVVENIFPFIFRRIRLKINKKQILLYIFPRGAHNLSRMFSFKYSDF